MYYSVDIALSKLRLRMSPGLGALLNDPSPKSQVQLAIDAQRRLERSPVWFYEPYTEDGTHEYDLPLSSLSNDELTLALQRPTESNADWNFDIIKVRRTMTEDRYSILSGRQIDDLKVFPATHETSKNPTIDRVFVVILNYHEYERMPQHDRYLVSAAWKRAHRGRQYEMIELGAYSMYQMTAISTDASTSADTEELDTILQDYGIGRLSNDPFELRLLGKMLDEKRRVP